ncbi:MAG: resolvase [Nitrosopumilus sp. B06]|nr:MAG: resolvase [Nitrosopumilus sp. B06]
MKAKKTARSGPKSTVRNGGRKGARLRRQRGYHWEDTLVKRFNGIDGWSAFRLGSPSTGLPDVLAVSTTKNTIFAIEAKSGSGTALYVPAEQIQRCMVWVKTFGRYKKRDVLLAFKFLSKKRVGTGKYESRQLREYYKAWNLDLNAADCVCTYDGRLYSRTGKIRTEMYLKERVMPFKTRHSQKSADHF